MSRYVVSYMSFFDNAIRAKCVEANDWREAIIASNFGLDYAVEESTTIEEAHEVAFSADEMFNVLLIE